MTNLRDPSRQRETRPSRRRPGPLGNSRPRAVAVLALSLAAAGVVGCGRSQPLGASTPDAAAPSTATTTTNGALCAVTTTQTPPFDVTFSFRAVGAVPVYVRTSCGSIGYGVSSCASGFAEALGPLEYGCGLCECSAKSCPQVSCGACLPDEGTPIAPGASLDKPWSGVGVELGFANGSQCMTSTVLAAAKYRVSIRVYDNAADAAKGVGGWIATRDFELPAAGGVVDVPLGANAPESCETSAGASTKACTGREARDVACELPQTVTFHSEGGELAVWQETYTIEPPARFTATRTSYLQEPGVPTPPVVSCSTEIPRCSADARVVTTADVARALAAPSVVSAFASPMALFGARSMFGSIFVVQRSDGASFGIADDCAAAAGCRPVTDDLKTLEGVLGRVEGQLINRSCPVLGPH